MKTGFLFSISSLCIAATLAYGMNQDEISELTGNQKISCLASLASYGDVHEGSEAARLKLEDLGFKVDKNYEDSSLDLKMVLWTHTDDRIPIIATRGTIPTLENILSDVAIFKYSVDSKEPYNYVSKFLTNLINNWEKENYINNTVSSYLKYLPTDTSMHELKAKGGSFLGGLVSGGLSSLALTPLGAGVVGGLAIYATYQVLGGYLPEAKAVDALVATSQMALKKTNEWTEEYEGRSIFAGHSLGGLLTTIVTELTEKIPQEVWTFNAPGGAERFIRSKKKYIMGGQDDTLTWLKKSVVLVEEDFPHDFRKITQNIGRKTGAISCFGGEDASRKSILVKDYYSPQCPMDFQTYLMQDHSLYNLAKDLGVLEK